MSHYTHPPPQQQGVGYRKQQSCPIEASNIANLGSELEAKIKQAAAHTENAWKGAGTSAGVLKVWRIEKFTVQPWPEHQLGKFYNGDTYIILHTYKKGDGNALGHDVHFWLGKNTSQDESGTGAYKTVELDDFLGGAAVQHREVQEHESELFLNYFPNRTIQILEGGIDSGFHHVEAEKYEPRLLQLKGTGNRIRVTQVPLSHTSLNSGDVFILDLGQRIIQWNGKGANLNEKVMAGKTVRAIRDERGGKAEATMHSEGDNDLAEFWAALGGEGPVKSAAEGGADQAASQEAAQAVKLFRLSDAGGKMDFKLVEQGSLHKKSLDTSDVFVLDNGAEVFVWIGRGSSKAERAHGMKYAQQYLTDNARPNFLPISRVLEGGENQTFDLNFVDGNVCSSRDIGDIGSTNKHACCPHYPPGSAFAGAPAGMSNPWTNKDEGPKGPVSGFNQDDVEKVVTSVFSFFSGKVKEHLAKR